MTEPLAQAKALFEHFQAEVVPTAWVNGGSVTESALSIPVFQDYTIVVCVYATSYGLRTELVVSQLPVLLPPDDIARVGSMLIQISNLVRQIRTLAGGNASDSSHSKTAV